AAFFEEMLSARPNKGYSDNWREWLGQLQAIGKRYSQLVQDMYQDTSPLRPQYIVHEVAERLKGQNPIVVTDVGQHQMYAAQHYPVESARSFLTTGGLGTMGFGLPGAIGASVSDPDRTTVRVCGDGRFQLTSQDLGSLEKLQ